MNVIFFQVGELSVARSVVAGGGMGGGEGVEVPGENVRSMPLVIMVVICVMLIAVLVLGFSCLMFGGRRKRYGWSCCDPLPQL